MKYDAVVIGSGAKGLCSAVALARHGQRVALVEHAPQLAPLLRRFHRDSWWCDPAPDYFGGLAPSGPLSVMFRYLGVDKLIQAVPLDPSPPIWTKCKRSTARPPFSASINDRTRWPRRRLRSERA